jgi:MFS family permease
MSGSTDGEMAGAERRRVASLAAVITASFGVGMAFGVGFPLTGLTLEAWNTPAWLIGIAGAAPALGVLTTLPVLPGLVMRLGVVRAIALGCTIGALGFVALALVTNVYAWIAIRYLMSAGLALPWLAGETWINMVTREETRGRVIAIYAISFFSGYTAGPLLLSGAGLTGYLPFALGALSMMLAGLPIVLAARIAPDISAEGSSSHNAWSAARLAPIGMAAGLISGFAEMSYLSLIGNVGIAGGLVEAQALKLMSFMTFGGVALQFLIGWLADKSSRTGVTIGLGLAFIVLSLMLPAAIAGAPSPFAITLLLPGAIEAGVPVRGVSLLGPLGLTGGEAAYAVAFMLGGVVLGFYTVGLAIVGEEVEARDLAAANAAFLVMYQLGAIVGPAAAGLAMTVAPVEGFVVIMALLMAFAVLAVSLMVWRRRRRHALPR